MRPAHRQPMRVRRAVRRIRLQNSCVDVGLRDLRHHLSVQSTHVDQRAAQTQLAAARRGRHVQPLGRNDRAGVHLLRHLVDRGAKQRLQTDRARPRNGAATP